jgi:cytochrome d ubiquinol oxidase subunit II
MDLVLVWAALVALAMILYVLLDGISLGVEILFPTGQDKEGRNLMMESIAPVWDANQTWLVFGGGAIFAAFPVVYGVLASALYLPLMTFIAGLIFRGVTFEFRAHSTRK